LHEIIYLCTLSPKTNYIFCKVVEIDHAEARKYSGWKPSGFFQGFEMATLAKHFESIEINLICISIALILQRNEDTFTGKIAAVIKTEVNPRRNRD